jgi:hypothetical protein
LPALVFGEQQKCFFSGQVFAAADFQAVKGKKG